MFYGFLMSAAREIKKVMLGASRPKCRILKPAFYRASFSGWYSQRMGRAPRR
jgi:hypothetical protein